MRGVLDSEDIELEMICPACRSIGKLMDSGRTVECALCKGTGMTTTAFGDAILALVKKYAEDKEE